MQPLILAGIAIAAAAVLFLLTIAVMGFRAHRQAAKIRRLYGVKAAKVTLLQRFRWHAHHDGRFRALWLAPMAFIGLPVVGGFWESAKTANEVHAGPSPSNWFAVPLTMKTVANLRSGRLVKKDTTDDSVQIAAAGDKNAIAIVGVRNYTNPAWVHTTAPAANDVIECFVLVPGQVYKFRNGANLAQGDQAQWGATGLAALAAAAFGDTAKRVCRVTESKDGSGTEGDIMGVVC